MLTIQCKTPPNTSRMRTAFVYKMAIYEKECCVRGFHVYKDIWMPVKGEILDITRENDNPHDKYAVAVKQGQKTVGHIPREISKTVAFFLKHGGKVSCRVVSEKHQPSDIAKGGLEIPCVYIFSASPAMIKKLKTLI